MFPRMYFENFYDLKQIKEVLCPCIAVMKTVKTDKPDTPWNDIHP